MDKREYTHRVVSVMGHITAAEREAIRAEIENHIEDRMEPLLSLQGVDEAEAERRSIAAMGDPEEIGRALQKQYSRFWLWVDRILLAIIVFVLLGTAWLAPRHLGNVKDNLIARYAPMRLLPAAVREIQADRELELKAVVGSDILRICAAGTAVEEERGGALARVFWCGYDESIHGQWGGWYVEYEDCRGNPCRALQSMTYSGNGGETYMSFEHSHAGERKTWLIVGGAFAAFTAFWVFYVARSIQVGRHPERYSRKTIRRYFKDGYVR